MKILPKIILLISSMIALNSCGNFLNNLPHDVNTSEHRAPTTEPPQAKIPITVYYADDSCENFQPETIEIPQQDSLQSTVALIIDRNSSSDFKIVGYRVWQEKDSGTIDLRIAPDSPRQIKSLSFCEQFALFASLRETLTRNPHWNIKTVTFLQQGQKIIE